MGINNKEPEGSDPGGGLSKGELKRLRGPKREAEIRKIFGEKLLGLNEYPPHDMEISYGGYPLSDAPGFLGQKTGRDGPGQLRYNPNTGKPGGPDSDFDKKGRINMAGYELLIATLSEDRGIDRRFPPSINTKAKGEEAEIINPTATSKAERFMERWRRFLPSKETRTEVGSFVVWSAIGVALAQGNPEGILAAPLAAGIAVSLASFLRKDSARRELKNSAKPTTG